MDDDGLGLGLASDGKHSLRVGSTSALSSCISNKFEPHLVAFNSRGGDGFIVHEVPSGFIVSTASIM